MRCRGVAAPHPNTIPNMALGKREIQLEYVRGESVKCVILDPSTGHIWILQPMTARYLMTNRQLPAIQIPSDREIIGCCSRNAAPLPFSKKFSEDLHIARKYELDIDLAYRRRHASREHQGRLHRKGKFGVAIAVYQHEEIQVRRRPPQSRGNTPTKNHGIAIFSRAREDGYGNTQYFRQRFERAGDIGW
ncbi:hypothetical protein R75461_07915 [Paraburkholderia nemoris]|nr:hypothetical protein R75461_07915 [Paraburkholderia nemoris]